MVICIYHSADLDGWASAAIVNKYFTERDEDVQLVGWNYGQPYPEFNYKDEDVVFVDVMFSVEEMTKIAKVAKSTLIIDHHAPKIKELYHTKEGVELINNHNIKTAFGPDGNKFSACELAWMYFYGATQVPKVITAIGQYDTWRTNGTAQWENETLPFQMFMDSRVSSPEEFVNEFFDVINLEPYVKEGKARAEKYYL